MTELVTRSLADCESVIERGLQTFVEVGRALLEIRDARLYRESHGTFEDYCRERWGFSRPRAYELMHAAEVVGAVSAIADTPTPRNESVTRELAPLRDQPEVLRETWAKAVEQHGDTPTAAQVREVVRERQADPPALQAVRERHEQTDVLHHLATVNHRMAILQITRDALLDQLKALDRKEALQFLDAIAHDLDLLGSFHRDLGAHLSGRLEAIK